MMSLINEAVKSGARKAIACDAVGISIRTLQRWISSPLRSDKRVGPKSCKHALNEQEKLNIIETCNNEKYRNLAPNQIVPLLADAGIYIASERSFYRVLAEAKLNRDRGRAKPKRNKKPEAIVANRPLEVWS